MIAKNEQIKKSIKETRDRRSGMNCRVYEVKVVRGKLSQFKKNWFDALFCEAKWLRNSELGKDDVSNLDRNAKTATVKVGDKFEVRDLTHLGSQMKQDIVDQIKTDAHGLHERKEQGHKVGRLKFKSYCNSIPLRQYGTTFRIDFEKSTVTIQGLRKPIKVRGLKQIPPNCEIANAKLVRKPSGYYFHITTYQIPLPKEPTGAMCGIDFGIKKNLTTSDGKEYDISVPESRAVKIASKRVNKAYTKNGEMKSNNHRKRVGKLQRAYERQNNRKNDIANKTVHELKDDYDIIAIQDEMIANWHKGLFGKQVQRSAMGKIKAKLKNSSQTLVVPRSFPSTQICPICGELTKHPLPKRSYDCRYCGYHHPSRDVKAAESILAQALLNGLNDTVSLGRRAQSPVEVMTSVSAKHGSFAVDADIKSPPLKQEAHVL